MDFQSILIMIAPSLAGCSVATIICILTYKVLKKLFERKISSISENAEFKKLHDEVKELKEILNNIRGKTK